LIPPVYPITDTRVSGLSHVEQLKRLIAGGATLVQLRDKELPPRDFYEQALECVAYARPLGVKIIINDRTDIAMMTEADGVHLGQDDMPPHAARKLLGPDKLIGYSTHSVEQAVVAASLAVDYIAIGPVFATGTKSDVDPVVGIAGITKVRSAIGNIPLVAIGGIDVSNVADVLASGADSAAVISGILADPAGIEAATRTILQIARR
jgi:thiamine-phosphate pyrophosphorylase